MFSAMEQLIIDRLRAKMPADMHVGPRRDLEAVAAYRQKAPAVWVTYQGYRLGERPGQPGVPVQQVIQDWWIVVATKSARGNGDVEAARDLANDACEQVIAALLGFQVSPGRHLRLEEAPGPEYDAGYCYVPVAFSIAATFKGQP
jgi:phage gp37-like protein